MTDKVVNYSAEVTAELVEAYKAESTDETRVAVVKRFAKELGKSEGSVRAKLVSEGVYKAVERVTKRTAKKAELVASLAKSLGIEEEVLDSFEKATAVALVAVIGKVGKLKRELEGVTE